MALSVKTPSGWRNASALVKVGGAWKEVSQLYVKQDGAWKPLWSYGWKEGEWAACSTDCGGGTQSRDVSCQRNDGQPAAESLCSGVSKPETSQSCNTQACVNYSWITGAFGGCSAACGDSVKRRTVTCKRENANGTFTTVADSFCEGVERPADTEPCLSCTICADNVHSNDESIINNKALQLNATQHEGRTDWTAEEARALILLKAPTPPLSRTAIQQWWQTVGYKEKVCGFANATCCDQLGFIYHP